VELLTNAEQNELPDRLKVFRELGKKLENYQKEFAKKKANEYANAELAKESAKRKEEKRLSTAKAVEADFKPPVAGRGESDYF